MLVVATGVFEILHPGHIKYLEESKSLGDRLIVVVARDQTARRRKRHPVIPERQRLHMVKSLKAVDGAILGGKGGDIYLIMKKLKPDILTIGPDQDFDVNDVQMGLKRAGLKTKVVKINNYWDAGLHSSRIIVDLIKRQ